MQFKNNWDKNMKVSIVSALKQYIKIIANQLKKIYDTIKYVIIFFLKEFDC